MDNLGYQVFIVNHDKALHDLKYCIAQFSKFDDARSFANDYGNSNLDMEYFESIAVYCDLGTELELIMMIPCWERIHYFQERNAIYEEE